MSRLDKFMVSPWPLVILAALALLVILGPSCSVEATFKSAPAASDSTSEVKP
jgi:hypothetical protein